MDALQIKSGLENQLTSPTNITCSAELGKNNLCLLLAARCLQTECHCNLFLQRRKDTVAFCEENTGSGQQLSPPKTGPRLFLTAQTMGLAGAAAVLCRRKPTRKKTMQFYIAEVTFFTPFCSSESSKSKSPKTFDIEVQGHCADKLRAISNIFFPSSSLRAILMWMQKSCLL